MSDETTATVWCKSIDDFNREVIGRIHIGYILTEFDSNQIVLTKEHESVVISPTLDDDDDAEELEDYFENGIMPLLRIRTTDLLLGMVSLLRRL